ncbi:MAG TPA: AAA family ATPase [Chthoniobacterales bacterium]|nr:AAA family ATPase [Chthoniobacterales bacterium]
MSEQTNNWPEENQRLLMAAVATVRAALERHAHRTDAEPAREEAQPPIAASDDSALSNLCRAFGLSAFERSVLLLCAGMELDSGFATHCASAQGDPRKTYPTFSLALAALPEPHWSALLPTAALRHWRLVEASGGDSLTTSSLRIDERILHYLTGLSYLDERLHAYFQPLRVCADLPPSHTVIANRAAALWQDQNGTGLIELFGEDDSAKRAIAAAASSALGLQLRVLRVGDIPAPPVERDTFIRLWERETMLSGGALLVDCCGEDDSTENKTHLTALLRRLRGPVALATRQPLRDIPRPVVRLEVRRPALAEQRTLWRDAVGDLTPALNGELDGITAQFSLGVEAIYAARAEIKERLEAPEAGSVNLALWDICRNQTRRGLENLAQRIEPAATWDDLVLPEAQRQTLREMAAHVRQRTTVYERWGFAAQSSRGLGISALFAGSSGTGKTMAAEVLANELRLDLYRIDLSSVVSKYIGETEKNLRLVFDAAEQGGAILLFDEADALFGKRTEVKDSHDRYANIEVSYLLQRMEAYRGLAILTTNRKESLDSAFLRRLRFVVQFPFPDAVLRAEIWRRIFPANTPTEDLDPLKLSRLNVAGGNIRNVALNAAFLAADANEPVRMKHLLRAARGEYLKLEKPLTESEIGGWA